jgi:hypothetical protein
MAPAGLHQNFPKGPTMSINFFDLAHSTAVHIIGIAATFTVLVIGAVFIDWVLRECERGGTNRSLVKILHVSANALVLSDIAFIALDVFEALGPYFMKASGAA